MPICEAKFPQPAKGGRVECQLLAGNEIGERRDFLPMRRYLYQANKPDRPAIGQAVRSAAVRTLKACLTS